MKSTTHDLQAASYLTPYVDPSPDHWSTSSEWIAYLKAKADAQLPAYGGAAFSGPATRVERETDEMKQAYAAFQAKFPPVESTPAPTQALSARDTELQVAQIALRRAVGRLRVFAHPLAIVDLVTRMLNE